MKKLIRKTLSGTEYWDDEAKRILFVPAGKEPDMTVTKVTPSAEVIDQVDLTLDDMNVDELLDYANLHSIEVPGNMKKEETIRKYINDALTDAE